MKYERAAMRRPFCIGAGLALIASSMVPKPQRRWFWAQIVAGQALGLLRRIGAGSAQLLGRANGEVDGRASSRDDQSEDQGW
jgi:hypothetical protein